VGFEVDLQVARFALVKIASDETFDTAAEFAALFQAQIIETQASPEIEGFSSRIGAIVAPLKTAEIWIFR
jgi:hypothetical protein